MCVRLGRRAREESWGRRAGEGEQGRRAGEESWGRRAREEGREEDGIKKTVGVMTRIMEHCDDTVMEICDDEDHGALSLQGA